MSSKFNSVNSVVRGNMTEAETRVMQHFIDPYIKCFGAVKSGVRDGLFEELADFDPVVLGRAIRRLRNSSKSRPSIDECIAACKYQQAKSEEQNSGRATIRVMPWIERDRRIRERVNSYMQDFRQSSQLLERAKSEGWDADLEGYVKQSALIQAQMIEGCKGIAFSGDVVASEKGESAARAFARFRESIADHVATEVIVVDVPNEKIEKWRQSVEFEAKRKTSTAFPMSGDLAKSFRKMQFSTLTSERQKLETPNSSHIDDAPPLESYENSVGDENYEPLF